MNKRDNYLILDDLITNNIKLEPIHLTKEQEDALDNGKVIRLDNGAIMARIKGTEKE